MRVLCLADKRHDPVVVGMETTGDVLPNGI